MVGKQTEGTGKEEGLEVDTERGGGRGGGKGENCVYTRYIDTVSTYRSA